MANITVTSANIRALQANGAIVRRYLAGGTVTVGYAVYIASDGDVEHADGLARGLKHLSEQRFDVVLLNPALPDAQGADAIAQVHEQAPGVPIILQTPADTDMLAAAAPQFDDVDSIINGDSGRRLLASSVIHAVKRRRAEEELRASEA